MKPGNVAEYPVSAIVLAAGESRRMGAQNKLVLDFRGKTVIETIVDNVRQSRAAEVVVVLGHQRERVRAVLEPRPVKIVENPHFAEGMTTSIHAGVTAADPAAGGYMICLSDLPFILPAEFDLLIEKFAEAVRAGEKDIIVPVYQGLRGNPVIFSRRYREDILAQRGVMGCRGIVKQHPERVLTVEMPTDNILKDIDTPEDYARLRECADRRMSGGGI